MGWHEVQGFLGEVGETIMQPTIFSKAAIALGSVLVWTLFLAGAPAGEQGGVDDNLKQYPTAGIAFREPEGWQEQIRDDGKTIAWWISPDSKPSRPVAAIMIECGRPTDATLEDVARGLAKDYQGIVDDQPTSLGGTPAIRVRAENKSRKLKPVEWIAAIHEGLLYLVMGGITSGNSVAEELESIRSSWQWAPIEPPYKHLEFRDQPLALDNGKVTVNVPELMRIYPNNEPDRLLEVGLPNFVRSAPDFLAYIQIMKTEQNVELDAFKEGLSSGLVSKGVAKAALNWTNVNNDSKRVITNVSILNAPKELKRQDNKQPPGTSWALVKLDDDRIVMVNFTFPQEAPGEKDVYEKLAMQIVATIELKENSN